MARLLLVILTAIVTSPVASAQDADSALTNALKSYVVLHRSSTNGLAPPTDPAAVERRTAVLAARIQAGRKNARPGDILGPAANRIREAVRTEMAGPHGAAIRSSIDDDNVYGVRLRVNHRYPPGLPRATMPTPILTKLPALPEQLEFRFLGRSLILIDTQAGLVVDVLYDVLPVARGGRGGPYARSGAYVLRIAPEPAGEP
jgi:hypothetical protein